MFNPPNFYPNPSSYADVLKLMTRHVQENKADEQLLEILKQIFEKELSTSNIRLSRPDRTRLFQQVSTAILKDVLGKLGQPQV
jgi:16S rRNA A1518/A1519 N6-dimethyltransferase RsmA/KsgA/DIM1 with predicted DNA glycosylase/AP lyase activity